MKGIKGSDRIILNLPPHSVLRQCVYPSVRRYTVSTVQHLLYSL